MELAGCSKLLAGQKVFLSPSIKPPPSEMADIITCSGGQVLTTLPHPPGVGVLIVASPDDLSMLSTAVESGMAVHSTEIILGGVLRQELDLTVYPTSNYFFITLVCVARMYTRTTLLNRMWQYNNNYVLSNVTENGS